jgi:hypothetical protein
MGDVVPFKPKEPEELHDVFVTFTGKWPGKNGEHAAMKLAKSLCNVAEPFMGFYDGGKVSWGEIVKKPKKKPPKTE